MRDQASFVEIYTDGFCLGNPGPGGWGAVLTSNVVAAVDEGVIAKLTPRLCETVVGYDKRTWN